MLCAITGGAETAGGSGEVRGHPSGRGLHLPLQAHPGCGH